MLQVARVKVFVETNGGTEANKDIERALEVRIKAFALENGFSECRPSIFFQLPPVDPHRTATAILKKDDYCFVADSASTSTHLRVCDVQYGDIVSGEDVETPDDTDALIALLKRKQIRTYRAWDERPCVQDVLKNMHIAYEETPTILPPSK